MDYKDYYKILGVERDAKPEDIKRVYRRLARKYHPDVSKEADAENKFKEVQEAYEVLKDPEKRAAYDQLGSQWRQGQSFTPPPDWGRDFEFTTSFGGREDSGFSDFFSSLFGARSAFRGQRGGSGFGGFSSAGEDHAAKIQIDLEDAFRGGAQNIELKTPQLDESGRVLVKPRTLKVTIPAGVIEGQKIRLAGQGSPGAGGGPAGDLYLEIGFKPHRLFQAEGRDITLQLPIAPWEAALGATVPTPTLAGTVDLRIPANAKAGQKLRLRGRGLPGPTPGDQYVVLKIVLPPADSPKAKELYEQMQKELPFDPRAEMTRAE
ncbi:curved DNA-binding protein [Povalibacter uvarum]|uniref:Curved DNA-binding protein n=1 Tax=Povalibacter uvarum TaxID=732238 RepID=A0A841HMY5_9GAMM|nr:DnaJ C-terminal domain-containing protein [Povalibacter uvarum]MBB6093442.1 curved DNA-binding protein [Povalibacter uvarum]